MSNKSKFYSPLGAKSSKILSIFKSKESALESIISITFSADSWLFQITICFINACMSNSSDPDDDEIPLNSVIRCCSSSSLFNIGANSKVEERFLLPTNGFIDEL